MERAADGHRENPIVTVDSCLFTLRLRRLHLFLVRRDNAPYRGHLALPGGYVHAPADTDTAAAAKRIVETKLHLEAPPFIEQLYTFSGPVRDPRGWSVAVAYMGVVPQSQVPERLPEGIELLPVDGLPPLPFDHDRIVEKALQRLRNKATYSSLPAFLLPDGFTMAELQDAYEQVLGHPLTRTTFRRRIGEQDMIEEIPGKMRGGSQRPAQVYRLTSTALKEFERTI